MKIIGSLSFFTILFLFSCESKTKDKKIDDIAIQQKAREITDKLLEKSNSDETFDTLGLFNSPIKILNSKFVDKEYSTYRDISLTYKNISDKKIEGIRFRWYALNAFNEPAEMGGYVKGYGGGFDDNPLNPGKVTTSQWSILSNDGKKIVLAWPSEIVFTDGSKWECRPPLKKRLLDWL